MTSPDSIRVDRYYEQLSKNSEVAVGILDITRDITNLTVQKRTFDMTFFYINRMLKMGLVKYAGFHKTIDDILEETDRLEMPYAMVACQGLLLFRGPSLVTQCREYGMNNPEFFVLGHIMNKQGVYPGLHRQYLFVNMKKWKELGKPSFDEMGHYPDRKKNMPDFTVSESTVHSEYTPKWIGPGSGNNDNWTLTNDGSNWIKVALENNISIDNLDNRMRETKVFLHPETDSEKLASVWYNKDQNLIDQLEDYSQKGWLRKLEYQENIEKNRVYAFNTETLSGEGKRTSKPIDVLFAPAAGFKPLAILQANGFHENTVVCYYDWCEASLNFKKHLLETWNGYDFDEWLLEHDLEYNFASSYRRNYSEFWQYELYDFNGREAFKELWDSYSQLEHYFFIIDIVNNPEKLFDELNKYSGTRVLWTTNIWSSEMLHWNMDPETIEEKWLHFESLIPNDLILYGHDYVANDIQERIRNGQRTTHPRFPRL